MALRPLRPTPEYLLGTHRPYGTRWRDDGTGSGADSNTVPGLADAETVDLTGTQGIHEKRRRNHDETNVAARIDSRGRQPVAQLVVVTGERIHHGESQWLQMGAVASLDHSLQ